MGWKNVKEHYQIDMIVHVVDGRVYIGSSYIPDIIIVDSEGRLEKRYDGHLAHIVSYQNALASDPALLRRLIQTPDTFARALPVFTYSGGDIIEKRCEEYGYPNITHDGDLMYANTHSPDRAKVVRIAKENAAAGVEFAAERVENDEERLKKSREQLAQRKGWLAKLNADYPEITSSATA